MRVPSAVNAAVLAAAVAGGASAQPLYDFSKSSLVQLTDANFDELVTKDRHAVWVVEFYADWCGHCKAFAKDFEKAALNMAGLVKYGAVNADTAKATAMANNVQGYPTIKVFLPEVSRNPYTGKLYKPAKEYSGPRKARGLVDFAASLVPSSVVQVEADKVADFASNGSLPKALLFTSKPETTTLLKSLSLALSGRMLIGETRAPKESAAAASFGVEELPSLFVLREEGPPHLRYEAELKPQALREFLEKHAAAEAEAEAATGDEEHGGAKLIDLDAFTSTVVPSKEPWLLFLSSDAEPSASAEASALAESLFGQVSVGVGSAAVAANLGVQQLPALVMLPFGTGAKVANKAKPFPASSEGTTDAKKAALETLPDNIVDRPTPASIDAWIGTAISSTAAQAVCLLFSEKSEVPPLFRSVSMAFEGKLGFAMVPTPLMARFNVQKAPALLVMFPAPAEGEDADGQGMQLQGMQFSPKMHGGFSYGNIANFIGSFLEMRLQHLGADSAGADAAGRKEAKPAPPPKDDGPLPELSADNFDQACGSRGGLCAVALLDGWADNSNKEAQLEMLAKLRQRKAGGPLSVSWVDATCHTGFMAHFELSETDLPTMIVMSPSKLRWARAIGAFDVDSLGAFGTGVATGRTATNPMQSLPPLEPGVDCSTVKRGAEVVEDDGLADEIMAEILEEERRAREEREAELAGSAAASAPADDAEPRQLSELEKMEKELEDCSAHDLLCMARREKQLAKIEKKRALEAKLKEMAKKKKKKNKKKKAA